MEFILPLLKELVENKITNIDKRINQIAKLKPLWTWSNEVALFESVENDEYINSYCRFVANKIIDKFLNILTKDEISTLSSKSYEYLKDNIKIDLRSRINNNFLSFTDIDKEKENLFKYFYITLSDKKEDSLQSIHYSMPKGMVMIEFYVLNEDGTVDAGRLKKIITNKSNLDHELTHALDINKYDSMSKVLKNLNPVKYNKHKEYYSNNSNEMNDRLAYQFIILGYYDSLSNRDYITKLFNNNKEKIYNFIKNIDDLKSLITNPKIIKNSLEMNINELNLINDIIVDNNLDTNKVYLITK